VNVDPILQLFGQDLAVVNLGLASFGENLRANGAKAVQVAWNVHNDRKLLQMELIDWRLSETG